MSNQLLQLLLFLLFILKSLDNIRSDGSQETLEEVICEEAFKQMVDIEDGGEGTLVEVDFMAKERSWEQWVGQMGGRFVAVCSIKWLDFICVIFRRIRQFCVKQ